MTRWPGGRGLSIPDLVRAQVARHPTRPALLWQGRSWSFAKAWLEVERFAGLLRARGAAGPAHRIASYLGNCPEAIWSWLGTLVAGSVHVSLNRQHRGVVLADMARRARPEMIVTDPEGARELSALGLTDRAPLVVVGEGSTIDPGSIEYGEVARQRPWEGVATEPTGLAEIIYTSGTTGRSKAALLPHAMFTNGARRLAGAIELTENDVMMATAPLYHVGGQLHEVLTAWAVGATVALFSKFSASRFLDDARITGATVFGGFGTMIKILSTVPARVNDRVTRLRLGVIAGIPPELHRAFEDRFGLTLIESTYGMTEAEPLTLPELGVHPPPGSVGRPGPDFELEVVDHDDAQVKPMVEGEVVVRPRSPGLTFLGYDGDEQATAEAWRNGWFHTGDLGRLDHDGFLYLAGRKHDRVRYRGENVSPAEVERILATHPAVADVVVVGVPSPMGDHEVKAVVIPRAGVSIDPSELWRFAASNMARFMVPRFIELVRSLPVTDVGKVNRTALRAIGPDTWDRAAQVDLDGGRNA